MKELSVNEKYLFSLTHSSARTPKAQRDAIEKAGLTGKTKKEIESIQRKNWKDYLASDKTGMPVWFVAAQYFLSFWSQRVDGWKFRLPKNVKRGVLQSSKALRGIAYREACWKGKRKRNYGDSCAVGHRIRTESNGKYGWKEVVQHHADYGLILSPDARQVAISMPGKPWHVKSCCNGLFFYDNEALRIDKDETGELTAKEVMRCKMRILQRAGFDARIVRQLDIDVKHGSAVNRREGDIQLVVDFGEKYGVYHDYCNRAFSIQFVVNDIRAVLEKRKKIASEKDLQQMIDSGKVDVYVCQKDSYHAGNCVLGTMQFAQSHRLNLSRHYCAADLLKIANGSTRFVRAAVLAAMRRERTENERGYCDLADHVGGAN